MTSYITLQGHVRKGLLRNSILSPNVAPREIFIKYAFKASTRW